MLIKKLICFLFCCSFLMARFCFAQQPRMIVPSGHLGEVSVTFNKKGDLLLSHSEDKTLLWNVKQGKVLIDLQLLNSKVLAASFNTDDSKLIAVANKGVCIIDIVTGIEEHCLTVKNTQVNSALIRQNTQKVITCNTDSSIIVWDLLTRKYLTRIKLPFVVKHISNFTEETFLTIVGEIFDPNKPDETTITKLVNIKTQQITDVDPVIYSVASTISGLSLRSDKFAFNFNGDIALLTDLKTKKVLKTYDLQEHFFKDIAISAKENMAAIADDSGILILDIKRGLVTRKNLYDTAIVKIDFIENENKLLIYNFNDSCYVYDYVKEKVLIRLWAQHNIHHYMVHSKNGNRIAYISGSNIVVFDTKKWIISSFLSGQASSIQSLNYNAEKRSLLTINNYKHIKQWDFLSANVNVSIKDPTFCGGLFGAYYCNNGSQIVVDACEDLKTIWDAESGKQLGDSSYYSVDCTPVKRNNECKNSYTRISINSVDIYDRHTDSLLFSIDSLITEAQSATLSPDGKRLIIIDKNNNVLLWDIDKKRQIKELYENQFKYTYTATKLINAAFFNSTGKLFVIGFADNHLDLWDSSGSTVLQRLQGSDGTFINDSTIAGINYGVISFYNNTGRESFRFIPVGQDKDYMIVLPNGYYTASEGAIKLVHYVKDQKIITFEQLDVKYNRPDKILEAIGSTDTALIRSYRKTYEKRIKKLGVDTTAFIEGYAIPEADFTNRNNINNEQESQTLTLLIKGIDSTYQLDRFNVWINETPIYGQRGINIRKAKSNGFDTTISIKLSQGENKIETSISNVNGTESYRMPLIVNYTPVVKQKEKTHFIGIGIDRFNDSKYNLKYSTKDIRDLSKKLKEKYKDIIIDTLFNENVTISNVKALKQKLLQTSVNDKVIISYSGHGLLSKEYDYYLSTNAVNFEKPEQNGLPYDELENLLDSIPARKKLMLIDACHSGEVDKDEGIAMNKTADSLGLAKGIIIKTNNQPQLGLKNSFELMQSLFVNVGKSTGATIISAAAGNQFALERGDLKNGVFTFAILEAMEKYTSLKISELKKIVGERVEQLTNGLQKPTSRNETIAVDWEVW